MRPHLSRLSLLVFAALLCTLCACTGQPPQSQSAPGEPDAATAAPNLMRMAALCNEHGGEWVKQRGCRMTEKLCTSTYHGAWKGGPSCTLDHFGLNDCNAAGGAAAGAGQCEISILTLDASQYLK